MPIGGPFQLYPERMPLAERLVVARKHVSAPVIKAHPFHRHPASIPNPGKSGPIRFSASPGV
jgi:hypothetical protein